MMGAAIYSCFFMPVYFAFVSQEATTFDIALNVVFSMDIIITFNTPVKQNNGMDDVYDRKIIAKNYITGWLIMDLIAVVSLSLSLSLSHTHTHSL